MIGARTTATGLAPVTRMTYLYGDRTQEVLAAGWHELLAMYRTVQQIDAVKLVMVDLDDTLWRGVIGDTAIEDMPSVEG